MLIRQAEFSFFNDSCIIDRLFPGIASINPILNILAEIMTYKKSILFIASLLMLFFIFHPEAIAQSSSIEEEMEKAIFSIENLEYERAIAQLERILLDVGPNKKREKAQIHKLLGIAYFSLEEKEKVFHHFLKALAIDANITLDSNRHPPDLIKILDSAKNSLHYMDIHPPVIEHDPITKGIAGHELTIIARVKDDTKVTNVILKHRSSELKEYNALTMKNVGNVTYRANIPGEFITSSGLQYYIEAYDNSIRPPAQFGSQNNPLTVMISRATSTKSLSPNQSVAIKASGWSLFVTGLTGLCTGAAYTSYSIQSSTLANDKRERAEGYSNLKSKNQNESDADKLDWWAQEYNKYSYIGYGLGATMLVTSSVLLIVDSVQSNNRAHAFLNNKWKVLPAISPRTVGIATAVRF